MYRDGLHLFESPAISSIIHVSNGETNSEGLALAYVEMCHQLDLDCRIVYGQLGGRDHSWNLIRLDGDFYHVDVSRCYDDGFALGFLQNDESMWNDYRWNISNYPSCSGELSYAALEAEDEPAAPAAVQASAETAEGPTEGAPET